MARITKINDFNSPELDIYVRLTGAQLRRRCEEDKGIFIAESPTVIDVALRSGCEPISLLTDERLINGAVEDIIARLPEDTDVFVAKRDILRSMTGFELTRGALCAMKRPARVPVKELCRNARRVAVLEEIAEYPFLQRKRRYPRAVGQLCPQPRRERAFRQSEGL